MTQENRYSQIIEKIFLTIHKKGRREVLFSRTDIEKAAKELGIKLPKNLGDIIYIAFDIELLSPLPSKGVPLKAKNG